MSLLSLVRSLRDYPARRQYRAGLEEANLCPPHGRTVLAFGEARPKPGEIIHGGRVKLLHLAGRFAHDESAFNVLYLVSSAIPRFALDLARWAKSRGAKLVWNQNGVGFPAWAGGSFAEFNAPMRELSQLADFVVYQSAFCRESAERYVGPAPCPSTTLFNPVDLEAFAPAPENPAAESWRMLAAGTHNQPFRVLGAIETLRLLRAAGRPAQLTIAGRFGWKGAEQQVREAIESAGVRDAVTLRPAFTQSEAVDLLRSAHVLLHAKYHDPCPTMVIEALACGVPVIGSCSGGMPELVGGDGGELIDVPLSWDASAYPEPAAMAGAVERIMRDWNGWSRQARARAERLFAKEAWLDAHEQIFQQVRQG